jgi:CRP/FNR family transcriptional regulator, nitrogen oxide reductase regulator
MATTSKQYLAQGQHATARLVVPALACETAANRMAASVQHVPLFLNISPPECREIVSAGREKEFSRHQTIYLEGDPIRQIILLKSGCVKNVQLGENGSEVILRLIGPGEVVGTVGLCTQDRHGSTAQALSACEALVWDAGVFENLSQRFLALRRNTTRILCKRLEEIEERFREISTEKVASRLSREIVRLLHQVGYRVNGATKISLSREELAQLTGTTLFTVSRLLSEWDQRGIVRARREAVLVQNPQALVGLFESE